MISMRANQKSEHRQDVFENKPDHVLATKENGIFYDKKCK